MKRLFHQAGIGLAAIGVAVALIALCTHIFDVLTSVPERMSSSEEHWEGFATMQRRLYGFLGGFGAFAFGSYLAAVCFSKRKI